MHQSGKVQAVKPEAGLDPSVKIRRLIEGLNQTNGVSGIGNNVDTCGRDRKQTGQTPQLTSQICGRQCTSAHEHSTQFAALPESYRHESESLPLLKLDRETLFVGDLLSNVLHRSIEIMLENDLNKTAHLDVNRRRKARANGVDTYGEPLFPPVEVTQRSLVVGEGTDSGPQILEEGKVTLSLYKVCHNADLGYGPGLRSD